MSLIRIAIIVPIFAFLVIYFKPELTNNSVNTLRNIFHQIFIHWLNVNENIPTRQSSNGKLDDIISQLSLKSAKDCMPDDEILLTKDELKKFDGSNKDLPIFLGYLGVVYDVSKGAKHYGPGGGYSFFAGIDGTRAFVTGEFNEQGLIDNIDNLSLDSYASLKEWSELYEKDYIRIGRVNGYYYDHNGCPTEKINYLKEMQIEFEKKKSKEDDDLKLYPPCNAEWKSEINVTRFWCTNLSGGVERDWIGVPREIKFPSTNESRCACIPLTGLPNVQYTEDDAEQVIIKEYDGCDPKSSQCIIKNV